MKFCLFFLYIQKETACYFNYDFTDSVNNLRTYKYIYDK